MSSPVLGHTPDGKAVRIDVDRLVVSRMLLQANSGGGKSWALRRILEQTYGLVQHLVLDVEGEFYTLREKFPYALISKSVGADAVPDPSTAAKLAHTLLGTGASAVIDIYELRPDQRILFVRRFLEALVDAPKDLWHPCLIVVDEAHVFCPEKGEAESRDAVVDLMTRGRKRGFCGVLATQRLSKLRKDAAAEANVKLIGRAALDLDMERAGDELGFRTKEDRAQLRTLTQGRFFAFGPGLSDVVLEVQVGDVQTTHPKAGHRAAPVPPTPDKLARLLAPLKDLPQAAAEEAKNLQEANRRIRDLERQVRAKPAPPAAAPPPPPKRVQVQVLSESAANKVTAAADQVRKTVERLELFGVQLNEVATALHVRAGDVAQTIRVALDPYRTQTTTPAAALARPAPRPAPPPRAPREPAQDDGEPLSDAQLRILAAARRLEQLGVLEPPPVQLGAWAGMKASGGYWRATIGRLRSLGYLEGTRLTDSGRGVAPVSEIQTVEDMHRHALELCEGLQRDILRLLLDAYPARLSPEEIGEKVGREASGGYWRATIGRLRSFGFATKGTPIGATPLLFLEGA